MAAAFRRFFRGFLQSTKTVSEANVLHYATRRNPKQIILLGCAAGFGSVIVLKQFLKINNGGFPDSLLPKVQADSRGDPSDSHYKPPTNYRELRFRQFASVEYDNNIYMTPQDFLESVTEESPRETLSERQRLGEIGVKVRRPHSEFAKLPLRFARKASDRQFYLKARIGRSRMSKTDLDATLRYTPALSKGSHKLFRKLHDKGMISYTEYLFLLCVLTKPHSGFRIAFNMFDTDGNQIVDKGEFLVLEKFFVLPPKERKFVPRDSHQINRLFDLEKVFSSKGQSSNSSSAKSKPPSPDISGAGRDQADQNLAETPDTTLLIHFFGKNGKNVLKYQDFHRFMENLQSEVIELEFLEFSKGLNTISEVEFARVLLRYTNLDKGDVDECLDRVRKRCPNEKGISFQEFKQFCQFLNNLDDFAIAMKMYTFANQSVSQEEFQRAVKVCTGYTLGPHIVNTVFQIFDSDGDGHLSHKEFISIMKDRLHRGARSHLMHSQNTWDAFKTCVKNEMKTF